LWDYQANAGTIWFIAHIHQFLSGATQRKARGCHTAMVPLNFFKKYKEIFGLGPIMYYLYTVIKKTTLCGRFSKQQLRLP